MKYLVPPQAPDHMPLANLPCLPERCNHCGKNFSRKSSLSKHMLVIHEACRHSKILHDRYLAKLMTHRRISFAICFITFKTRISFIWFIVCATFYPLYLLPYTQCICHLLPSVIVTFYRLYLSTSTLCICHLLPSVLVIFYHLYLSPSTFCFCRLWLSVFTSTVLYGTVL